MTYASAHGLGSEMQVLIVFCNSGVHLESSSISATSKRPLRGVHIDVPKCIATVDLVEEGSCVYPPKRNNRQRKSCEIKAEVHVLDKFCYNSTEPHANSLYCSEGKCWCEFELLPSPHSTCCICCDYHLFSVDRKTW